MARKASKPKSASKAKSIPRSRKELIQAIEVERKSVQIIKHIADSLPEPVCERRRELLPQIIHEWSYTDLHKHLSMDSRAIIRERIRRIELVGKCARELLQALNAVDETDRTVIMGDMLKSSFEKEVSRSEWANLESRLDEESDFLAKLAGIAPREVWKLGRGQPRNLAAYFVLQDAAAIFAWFTNEKAAREVDRIDHTETGPFFRFASVLWPVVFKRGIWGLKATMKNWGEQGSRPSALIANIDLRHPAWGIFECSAPDTPHVTK
jgi:hypothetical protein